MKKRQVSNNFEVLSDKSAFAYLEAFKGFRTNVEFSATLNNCKTVMLVSSLAGEGKTTASINLAIALAQNGKKVLLCDCDLRRPKVQRYLRVKNTTQTGVSSVLNGSCSIDNAIGYIDEYNIYVMLSGPIPTNPGELLASENSRKMLEELKVRFDYVICDTPPINIVADAIAFSKYIDGAVMVVRQNYASKNEILNAVNKLRAVKANLLGAVLNDYDSKVDTNYKYDRYYSYKYSYADEK